MKHIDKVRIKKMTPIFTKSELLERKGQRAHVKAILKSLAKWHKPCPELNIECCSCMITSLISYLQYYDEFCRD